MYSTYVHVDAVQVHTSRLVHNRGYWRTHASWAADDAVGGVTPGMTASGMSMKPQVYELGPCLPQYWVVSDAIIMARALRPLCVLCVLCAS
jgi:hypothetical protein